MLGVSRGTLRSALRRLEESGEIVRRQGSGTFVGRRWCRPRSTSASSGSSPTRRWRGAAGWTLRASRSEDRARAVGGEAGEALGLATGARRLTISRTLLAGGAPVAVMFDVVHPRSSCRPSALRAALERGRMVLDVLIEPGVPVTYARTRVMPALLGPRERAGQAAAASGARRRARARGADLRRARRAGRLLARPVRPGRARGDGDALARVDPTGADRGREDSRSPPRRWPRRREPGARPVGSVARAMALLDALAASDAAWASASWRGGSGSTRAPRRGCWRRSRGGAGRADGRRPLSARASSWSRSPTACSPSSTSASGPARGWRGWWSETGETATLSVPGRGAGDHRRLRALAVERGQHGAGRAPERAARDRGRQGDAGLRSRRVAVAADRASPSARSPTPRRWRPSSGGARRGHRPGGRRARARSRRAGRAGVRPRRRAGRDPRAPGARGPGRRARGAARAAAAAAAQLGRPLFRARALPATRGADQLQG